MDPGCAKGGDCPNARDLCRAVAARPAESSAAVIDLDVVG